MANKYLSDLHLGHAHVLEMSKRGERFADVDEMNRCFDINDHPVTLEELIENNRKWYGR